MRRALLLAVGLAVLTGCGTKSSKGTVTTSAAAVTDPWPAAVAGLRKETTPGGLGRMLGELTAATSVEPQFAAASLDPASEAESKAFARLTDDDLKALRPSGYSALDPHYLAGCLYLRDVVRTLDLAELPPKEQAERAFAWVCRQVVLAPWVGPGRSPGELVQYPPVPPEFVLRRGSGSGPERATVFLAVCQQLGIDGVLVGPPDAVDRTRKDYPFWAVGARVGPDVLLFDPVRAMPLGTLASPTAPPGVPADVVKASVPYLSVPLPALAPRWKKLEAELKADAPRLSVDLPATVKAFGAVKPAFWNPPGDPFAYPRVLASFTPPADGGSAPDPDLPLRYRQSQLPPSLVQFPFAPGLFPSPTDPADLGAPDALNLLRAESVGRIAGQFLVDPAPRERLQRGQPEAVRQLVGLRDEFQKGIERLRTDRNREASIRDWVDKAKDRTRKLAAARDRNPAALAAAEQEFQKFWADTRGQWSALVDLAAADTGVAEATYLLALARHEQAVREQARAARSPSDESKRKAAGAWAEARDWWGRYRPFAAAHDKAYPGRAAHADRLAGEAAAAGG